MRDGIRLFADVYRPSASGKCPVILQRTPYGKDLLAPFALRAAGQGYAVVLQDTRGRWQSEGVFSPFDDEQNDGFDTCAWLLDQPWCDGRIGMVGGSYVGATQWQAALSGAPGLKAITPNVTVADYHDGWCYQGGAFELGFSKVWALGLGVNAADRRVAADPELKATRDAWIDRIDHTDRELARLPLAGDPLTAEIAPYYEDWLAHPADDAYWDRLKIAGRYEELDLSVFNAGGWHDIFLGGTIANYIGMSTQAKTESARRAARLLIGPWSHTSGGTGGVIGAYHPGFNGMPAGFDIDGRFLRFYDRHLREIDNGLDDEPPVSIFVMGANRWRGEHEWPLARTRYVDYFFSSNGRANTLAGDGALSLEPANSDTNRPDRLPLQSARSRADTGRRALLRTLLEPGRSIRPDRDRKARRRALLHIGSARAVLEVTGPVKVMLYAASSARDTDFTAKLVDVCPCGSARNVTDGIIRARYRHSARVESLLTPGEVNEYVIDLWSTSLIFQAGHRIRVEISSSNFPRFDRNPNHGGVIASATERDLVTARQTIFHDREHPSRIILPVIDAPAP